jgi:endonuclease/exonuclease/phosphatase family metal-dependent hydrolase
VGPPRTSPDSVLFTTYNLLNLFQDDSEAGRAHYRLVTESIRALGTDVLAVQEIRAPDQPTAQARLRRLADDVGLRCAVPQPDGGQDVPALAAGAHGYHCLARRASDHLPVTVEYAPAALKAA